MCISSILVTWASCICQRSVCAHACFLPQDKGNREFSRRCTQPSRAEWLWVPTGAVIFANLQTLNFLHVSVPLDHINPCNCREKAVAGINGCDLTDHSEWRKILILFSNRLQGNGSFLISHYATDWIYWWFEFLQISPSFALSIFRLLVNLIFQQRQTFHSNVHDTYLFLECC